MCRVGGVRYCVLCVCTVCDTVYVFNVSAWCACVCTISGMFLVKKALILSMLIFYLYHLQVTIYLLSVDTTVLSYSR